MENRKGFRGKKEKWKSLFGPSSSASPAHRRVAQLAVPASAPARVDPTGPTLHPCAHIHAPLNLPSLAHAAPLVVPSHPRHLPQSLTPGPTHQPFTLAVPASVKAEHRRREGILGRPSCSEPSALATYHSHGWMDATSMIRPSPPLLSPFKCGQGDVIAVALPANAMATLFDRGGLKAEPFCLTVHRTHTRTPVSLRCRLAEP